MEVDGDVVHKPSLLINEGQTASINSGEEGQEAFLLDVDADQVLTISVPVYDAEGKLAGYPKLSVQAGEDATVSFTEAGQEHTVQVRTTATTL